MYNIKLNTYTQNACACLVRTVYKLIMNFQIIRYIVAFVECVKKTVVLAILFIR